MELKLKVKVECPELAAAFLALAEALPQLNLGALLSRERVQVVEGINVIPVAESKEELKTVTFEELKEKLSHLTKVGKGKEVTALVKSFGVSKLTDLPKENYEALLKQAESI